MFCVLSATALLSCQMVQTTAQAASSATGVGGLLDAEGGSEGALEMILAGLLGGVTELLQPQRDFWLGVAATIDQLEMTDQAIQYGISAAIMALCSAEGPDDFAPEGSTFEVLDQDDAEAAQFVASGRLGEHTWPLEVTIVTTEADSTVTLRGGGWLLCGLAEVDLLLDSEPLELGDQEILAPDLDVRIWPDPDGDEATDSVDPSAVEVTLTVTLEHEILRSIIEAELMTVFLADESFDFFLDEGESLGSLRDYLAQQIDGVPAEDRGDGAADQI